MFIEPASDTVEKFTDGTGRTFTTEVLQNLEGGLRYTAVVTDAESYAPYAWCGHSHRTEAAANVCRKGLLHRYEELRARVVARR